MGTRVYTSSALTTTSGAVNFAGPQAPTGPSGPASGDLGGTYPGPNVVALHSGATQLALGTIADTQLLARAGASVVGVTNTMSPAFDVATSSPASWWRADNVTQSAGLVDSILDAGSQNKPFNATLADRCALGTDADARVYLNLANSFYQAGAAIDWKFLGDGSTDWTIAWVFSKPTWPGNSNTPLTLLTNLFNRSDANGGGGGVGMFTGVNAQGSFGSGPGSFYGWETNQVNLNGSMANLTSGKITPASTAKQVMLWRTSRQVRQVQFGGTGAQNTGAGLNESWSDLWAQGEMVSFQQDPGTYTWSTATPQGTLTLGQTTNRAFPFTGRLYELVMWKRRLSNQDARGYAVSAASRYAFTL